MVNLKPPLLFMISIFVITTYCTSSSIQFNTTTPVYTTITGPPINPQYQLFVNFTLNYSTYSIPQTSSRVDIALKESYSICEIPSNYIHNIIQFIQQNQDSVPGTYSCNILSEIDTKHKLQAYQYQNQIMSQFAVALNKTLLAVYFLMTTPIIDIVDISTPSTTSIPSISSTSATAIPTSATAIPTSATAIPTTSIPSISSTSTTGIPTSTLSPTTSIPTAPSSSSSSSSSTLSESTQIILWCVGVTFVCIIGGLILIICGRKCCDKYDNKKNYIAKKRNEMGLNVKNVNNVNDNIDENDEYHTLQDDFDDVLVVKKPKKQIKKKYFSRLDDEDDDLNNNNADKSESVEYEEAIDEDVENDNGLIEQIPPTFDRI